MMLPEGRFDIVLADPPWRFTSNSDAKPGRNARRHYDTMRLPEIKAMPVQDMMARPALLFLWTTSPHLYQAMGVLDAWGAKYVSQLVWEKDRIGTGFWVRNRHEIVLLAKWGKFPCPKPAPFSDSLFSGQQREHSRKPDFLHEAIESAWPDARKVELFARTERPGWTAWGNETDKFNTESANNGTDRAAHSPA